MKFSAGFPVIYQESKGWGAQVPAMIQLAESQNALWLELFPGDVQDVPQ